MEANDGVLRVHTERTIREERFMLGHSFTYSSCSLPNYSTLSEKRSEKRSNYYNNRRGERNRQIILKVGKGILVNYSLSFDFCYNIVKINLLALW